MASDLGSAIDDSFSPNFFPVSVTPSLGTSTYNGPRSGHWSVSSSVGSAIDDRCLTVWGALSGPGATGSPGATAVNPINASLLKRIGRAAVETKAAAEVEVGGQSVSEADNEQQASVRNEVKKVKETTPKGFYVPKAKDAPVVKTQKQDKTSKGAKAAATKAQPASRRKSEKPRGPSPQPSVKSNDAPHAAPRADNKQPRVIRITGKPGQEAFVQLPKLPHISRAPTEVSDAVPEKTVKWANKPQKFSKTKPEPTARSKDRAAKVAAEVMMSGALPAPKKQQTPKQMSSVHSTPPGSDTQSSRDSAVGFGGLEAASNAPSGAMSTKSLQEAVRNITQNSEKSGTPSQFDFKAVGEGWVQAAAPVNGSKPAWMTARAHSDTYDFAAGAYRGSEESSASASPAFVAQSRTISSGYDHPFNGSGFAFEEPRQDPTVFAGKGWISPHPLSRAPSPVASPPQSRISLPFNTQHGREMSYDEWKAVQEGHGESKRFAHAESVVSSRVLAVAEGIVQGSSGKGSGRVSVAGSQAYPKVTMASEHGRRRRWGFPASTRPASVAGGWDALPGFGGLDGTYGDGGGAYRKRLEEIVSRPQRGPPANVQGAHLTMPWDGEESRRRLDW
ncbi:hypothetical protein B0A55_07860 [Friedmanniomyces simplex]|uniref:Uncharacterized protein n=1 Tax=Friedmanniomyces simplex TaxID=329884 RepID=A0A4U0X244_9PEZI|nr:hypothetical protein B0A55_07860 [Friedmanniomyces simplex]